MNRDALRPLLEEYLGARSRAEWHDALRQAGVPAVPVQTIDEAFSLAESLGLDVVDDTDGVRTVRSPPVSRRLRP